MWVRERKKNCAAKEYIQRQPADVLQICYYNIYSTILSSDIDLMFCCIHKNVSLCVLVCFAVRITNNGTMISLFRIISYLLPGRGEGVDGNANNHCLSLSELIIFLFEHFFLLYLLSHLYKFAKCFLARKKKKKRYKKSSIKMYNLLVELLHFLCTYDCSLLPPISHSIK